MNYQLGEFAPKFDAKSCFIAPSADLIGQVNLGANVSIWFGAVIRGDNDRIDIGNNSNIQDGAVIHTDPGIPVVIGERVTVGHKAILHGCMIGTQSLIGMNAVILNGAVIGKHCLVGANTLIPERAQVPDGVLVVGSPYRIVRELTNEEILALEKSAQIYTDKIELYKAGMTSIEALELRV